MTRKVITAIFDNDLRVELGKHEVSEDGTQIRIKSGGESHFMPSFDNDSFLEFPYRAITSFWKHSYRRMYIVKKKATACVNFKTGKVPGPNLEQLKQAIASTNLDKLGKQDPPFPAWIIYLILLCVLGIAAKVFGVLV